VLITEPRDPADLSKRAVEVLQWLAGPGDGELVVDGLSVWFGTDRTSIGVVRQLLECVFISNTSGRANDGCKVFGINESGRRWLGGLPPYRDSGGDYHATLFDLFNAEKTGGSARPRRRGS
jgi:hypothetical protein